MTRADLEALAKRCESEPASRELDLAIEIAVKGMLAKQTYCPWYTLYLDAAVSLVPGDASVLVGISGAYEGGNWARVALPGLGPLPPKHDGKGDTPALALCAAALRARAAMEKS